MILSSGCHGNNLYKFCTQCFNCLHESRKHLASFRAFEFLSFLVQIKPDKFMKNILFKHSSTLLTVAAMFAGLSAPAQQITGTPGSPSATTTVDGRYIPNPPTPFAGTIGLSTADSKP